VADGRHIAKCWIRYNSPINGPIWMILGWSQYYGKSLEALPGVAYPGFRDNRSTYTKTGFLKK